jgi:hypothetical protein
MDPIFKKMNFKNQPEVLVLQAPDTFRVNMDTMQGLTTFKTSLNELSEVHFCIAFVTRQEEIDRFASALAPLLQGDYHLWFCYPKGSSKKYKCDFNRDTGWDTLGKLGMEGVRQIAVDKDWSALRFRNVAYIKTMTRSFAMTEEGKKKAGKQTE